MTRNLLLFVSVAGIAITAPANAERPDRGDRSHNAQEARENRKAARQERMNSRQEQRAQRAQRVQENRQQRLNQSKQANESRQQRRAQRVQQSQQINDQRQQRRAQRLENIQQQQARQQRRAERMERVQEQRAKQVRDTRLQSRQERRAQRIEQQNPVRVDRSRRQLGEQRNLRAEHRATRIENRRDAIREARVGQNLDMARERFDARQTAKLSREERKARRAWFREVERREMRQMKRLDRRIRHAAIGQRISPQRYSSYVPAYYRDVYYDTPQYYYRYDDDYGYLYRVNRSSDVIASLIPLFGGYNVGNPWPTTYRSSYVPLGYRPYYYDTPDYYYRSDGYGIYRINAETQLISALVALVTGQPLNIGAQMPSSYGIYNVPIDYRSTYYDRPDAWYRYGDGFIYEVDPYSRTVEARYPLYSDAYYVGSPWPVAYPDYNVPYGYRDSYYDTPDYQYRYANGGIYQVDPKTQVIMALASLLTGNQFNVGQPMPAGYDVYNVPFAYRDRFYDTDDEYYRYADGYIYEIDPETGLIESAYPAYA